MRSRGEGRYWKGTFTIGWLTDRLLLERADTYPPLIHHPNNPRTIGNRRAICVTAMRFRVHYQIDKTGLSDAYRYRKQKWRETRYFGRLDVWRLSARSCFLRLAPQPMPSAACVISRNVRTPTPFTGRMVLTTKSARWYLARTASLVRSRLSETGSAGKTSTAPSEMFRKALISSQVSRFFTATPFTREWSGERSLSRMQGKYSALW